jgi:hypothetical protein
VQNCVCLLGFTGSLQRAIAAHHSEGEDLLAYRNLIEKSRHQVSLQAFCEAAEEME